MGTDVLASRPLLPKQRAFLFALIDIYTPRGYKVSKRKSTSEGACVEEKDENRDEAALARTARECPCRHKATPRSEALQADVQKRLNRAIGQLNGVKAMVEDNRYCGDVLTQLAAAESAVRRVSEMLLAEHMRTCVVDEVRAGNDEVIDEVMALMRRFSK